MITRIYHPTSPCTRRAKRTRVMGDVSCGETSMDTSESQFQELLAHVIARTNRMLDQQGYAFSLGLVLTPSGDVEVSVAAYEEPEQMGEVVNAMQASMR